MAIESRAEEPIQIPFNGAKIMLIYVCANNEIINQTLQDFLGKLGYETYIFPSLEELLGPDSKKYPVPDLILLGQDCPERESIKEIRKIHDEFKDARLIVMSEILPAKEALSLGVFGYLRWPVRLAELELMLARMGQQN